MGTIEFSSMIAKNILALDDFEAQFNAQVRHRKLNWETAWNDLVQIALYQKGPDVSEIGTTWLGSVAEMQAIRPFSDEDFGLLGGIEAFLPSAMDNCRLPGDSRVWSIPWFLDTRLIHYRRDLLQQAGVDEASAFQTPEQLLDTLQRLKASGVSVPFVMPTRDEIVIHNVASWIWGNGGSFRSRDGRRLTLDEPSAQAGILAYYRLHSFIPPQARFLEASKTGVMFLEGQAAVALSSQWLYFQAKNDPSIPRQVSENVHVAIVPGVPFLGGTNLIVWLHTLHEGLAIELIHFLSSPQNQRRYFQAEGILPTRREILELPPFTTDPACQAIAQSIQKGRGFSMSYRWAAVEGRLVGLLCQLWSDVFDDPDMNLEAEIAQRISSLKNNLEKTILASW